MVVFRVVSDYKHAAPGSDAEAAKAFHERKEGRAIELVYLPAELKPPVPQAHSAEVPHTAAGACSKTGSLVSGGIHIWQREPCCWKCTSSVAQRSTVSSSISVWSFFYAPFAVRDRPGQCWGAACATESPTAGTDADIAALPGQSYTLSRSTPPAFCRPIDSHPTPYHGASGEEQH